MKKLLLAGSLALLLVGRGRDGRCGAGRRQRQGKHLNAELEGFQEVPSISTNAEGEIKVKLNGSSIQYKLKYSGFDSTRTRRCSRTSTSPRRA